MERDTLVAALARKKAEQAQLEEQSKTDERQFTQQEFYKLAQAVANATGVLLQFLRTHEGKTQVTNFPDSVKTPDILKVEKAIKELVKATKPEKQDNSDVVAKLEAVNESVKAIPAPLEAVTVTNIADIASTLENAVKKLETRLSKLELSPKITVPKPQVTVEKTNVAGIIKELKGVKQEIIDKPVPGTTVVQTDPLIRFTPANMDDASTVQYYSYIAATGEYYIRKVDKSGAYTTIRYYFGTGGGSAHDTAWTGRAGLTYTMWSQ